MMFPNKKFLLILFFAALISRLVMTFFLYGVFPGIFMGSDGHSYLIPASTMMSHHTFAYTVDPGKEPEPDNFRTPLYPIFLIPFVFFGAPLVFIAIVQHFLYSIVVIIIYLMARKVFEERTARVSSMAFALEPFGIFSSNFIQPQNIYFLFFLPAIFFALYWLKTGAPKNLYYSSALLGIAALAKPIALAIFPLVFIAGFFHFVSLKKTALTLCISSLLFLGVISPWLIRNRISLHTWQFSSITDYNLYYTHLHYFVNFYNTPEDTAIPPESFLSANSPIPPRTAYMQAAGKSAKQYIREHIVPYGLFIALFAPRFYIQDEYSDVAQTFFSKPLFSEIPNLYILFIQFDVKGFFANLFNLAKSPGFYFYGAGKLIWGMLTLGLIITIIRVFSEKDPAKKRIAIFLLALLLLYGALHAPIGRAGYRVPMNIFIFALNLEFFLFPFGEYLLQRLAAVQKLK